MSLLTSIESRIANIVEGAFGRIFRSHVQPVELARRLVKEMDEHQHSTIRKVYVPNVYDVYLSRDDHAQFTEYESALTQELSEYLAEHARRNGYALVSRPKVSLHLDKDLELGSFGIAASTEGSDGEQGGDEPANSPGATMIYKPATPLAAEGAAPIDYTRESFQVVSADGVVPVAERRITLGRGRHNQVVVHDSSVSREHAEIVQEGLGYVVRDLGSTNGVLVNGAKVREQPLAPGDTIVLGTAELRFERAGEGAVPR